MAKKRLLDELVSRFPTRTREQLHARILCGEIYVENENIKDPRYPIAPGVRIELREARFVGRGGEKLDYALEFFGVAATDRVWLDAGASTGGFTDCLLQRGATFVHAVDVGTNQLAYSLRRDPRVHVMERTNLLSVDRLDPPPFAAVADLSFRSISGAAEHLLGLTESNTALVLIKPQFEWAHPPAEFSGTVPDPRASEILEETLDLLRDGGIEILGTCESPIRGRKGNREFFAYLRGGGVAPDPAR
jgi:23S rRNA (cytidine1920-2'-O)/16S rRNA (cytidine1409-2'-O)-methyltransferase